jgi:carbonic anhydrase
VAAAALAIPDLAALIFSAYCNGIRGDFQPPACAIAAKSMSSSARSCAAPTRKNGEFVDEVAKTNVRPTIGTIRERSDVLAGLEKNGKIKIVGSMYRLAGGRVEFFT